MSLERFTVICASDFSLLNRCLSGEDITPILDQRQALGFNSLRVWTAFDIPLIGRLNPKEHPDYYQRIPDFMQACAQYGFYVELTAFTGPYPFFANQAEMIAHWNGLDDALAECTNLLDLEAVNEGDNGPNLGVPLDLLRRPAGKLASHGSAIQDAPPMQPHWDVAGYRSPGSEWHRKNGHNAMEWADTWKIPVWTNEMIRTDTDATPTRWYDAAASAVLLCAGAGCFHSPEGKASTLFGEPTLTCAKSFVAGARSVPLEFQDGAYIRIDDNPPGILRVYRRQLSDGRFHEVEVRE